MLRFIAENRTRIPVPDQNNQYTQAAINQINHYNPPVRLDLRQPGRIAYFIEALKMYDYAHESYNNQPGQS